MLSAGSHAGVQYRVWELAQEVTDCGAEFIAGAAYKSVSAPDIAKIK